jgi:hypothetical protein
LRVTYDNGTESNLLGAPSSVRFTAHTAGRLITNPIPPLFAKEPPKMIWQAARSCSA